MTREQAINSVGLDAVQEVDGELCEPTNRVLPDGDNRMEWKASIPIPDDWLDGNTLSIYYMTTPEDEALVKIHDGDWGVVDWVGRVDRYEIN